MFEGFDEWLAKARQAGAAFAEAQRRIDEAKAAEAVALAKMIQAYRRLEDVPEPGWPEAYRVPHPMDGEHGEDLAREMRRRVRLHRGVMNQGCRPSLLA